MQILSDLQAQVIKAAAEAKRAPAEITIIAVSKSKPIEQMLPVIAAGQKDFGENYLQEAVEKIIALQNKKLIWHYLGRLQTNKIKSIVKYFDYVHSVASLKQAQALSKECIAQQKIMPILLQVNFDKEATKQGFIPEALTTEIQVIARLPALRLLGLMLIPKPGIAETIRTTFAEFRDYRDHLSKESNILLPHLSMGMSEDFMSAILEGATFIRIGTKIFGMRF